MSFTIEIRETRQVRKLQPKKWAPVDGNTDSKYDYTPEVETVADEDIVSLKQVVDELDLAAVIAAVNCFVAR